MEAAAAAATDCSPAKKRRSSRGPSSIGALDKDILCRIFALVDLFDLVRCSAVCKSWNRVINKSKVLQVLYDKQQGSSTGLSSTSSCSEKSLKGYIERLAMEHHRSSLQEGLIDIEQWKGHSVRVDQCRMKMGLILTGVGDKVLHLGLHSMEDPWRVDLELYQKWRKGLLAMIWESIYDLFHREKGIFHIMRLWSLQSYECLGEYSLPDSVPLVDFDFDESKIVGLIGTRMCIWRRNGKRSIFPSREGTFMKGLCMRYIDPEAVVGCEDGTARVFDMYSRKCSRIIRMHAGPVTCLSLSDDQFILSGSSLGSITISGLSSDQQIATLRSPNPIGIRTLCFNPRSHLVFAGAAAGYAYCWDLRKMRRPLWENRVSPNVIYSMQRLCSDTSTLAVGGIDGVLRILDQNTGEVVARCVMVGDDDKEPTSSQKTNVIIERKKGRRFTDYTPIDSIPRTIRPPIKCLAVGMQKVITTHNTKYIKVWKFH